MHVYELKVSIRYFLFLEVEDDDSGGEKKEESSTKKPKVEINIGNEHIKKLEVNIVFSCTNEVITQLLTRRMSARCVDLAVLLHMVVGW